MIEKLQKINEKIYLFQQDIWEYMSDNFTTNVSTLNECISKANTGADAIQKAPIVDYITNCKCVRVGDFTNNRDYNEWAYCKINDKDYQRYKLKKDDIIITRTASIGLTKYINEDLDAVFNNGVMRIIADKNKIKPIILYLICISKKFINYIKENESGSSTRPNMKIDYVLKYKFNLPSLKEQEEIEKKLIALENYRNTIIKEINNLNSIKSNLLKKYFG